MFESIVPCTLAAADLSGGGDIRVLWDDNPNLRRELAATGAVLKLEARGVRPPAGAGADGLVPRPGMAAYTSLPAQRQAQGPQRPAAAAAAAAAGQSVPRSPPPPHAA